jgi:hypothetical protein
MPEEPEDWPRRDVDVWLEGLPSEGSEPFIIDVVNNVVYNWEINAGISYKKTNQSGDINFVGNTYIPGRNSWKQKSLNLGVDSRVYAKGNRGMFRTSDDQDEFEEINWFGPQLRESLKATTPFPAPPVTTQTSSEAYQSILHHGGASLPARDTVDLRLIEELKTGRGSIIDHPSQVGGWPSLETCRSEADDWETARKRNPKDAGLDQDGSGYSDVENRINSLQRRAIKDLKKPQYLKGDGSAAAPLEVPFSPNPISVDGRLQEWCDVPLVPARSSASPKSNCRLMWTNEGLYGAVEIEDPLVMPYESEPYKADSFELFIETDHAKAASRDDNRNAFQLVFSPTENLISGPCLVSIPRDWPKMGLEFVYGEWKKTGEGYLIEFVIGKSFFAGKSLASGMKVGIDFAINNQGKLLQVFHFDKNAEAFHPAKWGSILLSGSIPVEK